MKRAALILLLLVLAACEMPREDATRRADAGSDCRVHRIVDGDTADVICPGGPVQRVRFMGFDTPEKFSPACRSEYLRALAAERHLAGMLDGAALQLSRQGVDRYGRTLARVLADGRDVAAEMIASGHARAYAGGRRQGWCA